MILNVRIWLETNQTQYEQIQGKCSNEAREEFTRKGGGESLRKIFLKFSRANWKVSYGYQILPISPPVRDS